MGRVVNVTDYGAFVELEPGVEGPDSRHRDDLVPPHEASLQGGKAGRSGGSGGARRAPAGAADFARASSSSKPNPWTTIEDRYSIGSVVEGRVRSMTDFGAFIEIEEGIDGLVHVSDLSWTKRVKHPSEVLKKGQMVQAVILTIDLQSEAFVARNQAVAAGRLGVVLRARIRSATWCAAGCRRIASFGVFVELAAGVEGLCHNSEIPGLRPAQDGGAARWPSARRYDFKIVKMNEAEKKIGLSLKAITDDEERTRLEDYQRQAAAATTTIEEVMSLKDRGGEDS